eukprot:11165241-Lingulodinium_polyedra.AAC.1
MLPSCGRKGSAMREYVDDFVKNAGSLRVELDLYRSGVVGRSAAAPAAVGELQSVVQPRGVQFKPVVAGRA